MLVDNADFYLSCTRGDRWLERHLITEGNWPAPDQAAILCTFHWGAGMWALRSMGSHGLSAHALVAPHVRANFSGQAVRYHYYAARNRENELALGVRSIEASSLRRLMQALNARQQVAVAADVPSDQAAANEPIPIIGLQARVPRALFRIAVESQVPMFVYLTGFRMSDGKRTLKIHPLGTGSAIRPLILQAFALLEQAIAEDPAAWHFWKVAPRFFCEPESP
jgi:lauroyl/myristoyl acyltransferase